MAFEAETEQPKKNTTLKRMLFGASALLSANAAEAQAAPSSQYPSYEVSTSQIDTVGEKERSGSRWESIAVPPSIIESLTPEQRRPFDEGIAKFNEYAKTRTLENAAYFIIYEDGTTEWKDLDPAGIVLDSSTPGVLTQNFFINGIPDADLSRIAKGVARIVLVHVHPTHSFEDVTDQKFPTDAMPSPTDMFGVMALDKLSALEHGAEAYVVAESKVWRYGFKEKRAANELYTAWTDSNNEAFSKPLTPEVQLGAEILGHEILSHYDTLGISREWAEQYHKYLDSDEYRAEFLKSKAARDVLQKLLYKIRRMNPEDTSLYYLELFFDQVENQRYQNVKNINPQGDPRLNELANHNDKQIKKWEGVGAYITEVTSAQ